MHSIVERKVHSKGGEKEERVTVERGKRSRRVLGRGGERPPMAPLEITQCQRLIKAHKGLKAL